ncbi:MAG: ATP-binding cassette domain-containing protein [Candidatus Lokiarchaeota archaeon]|nr:ATP-binding cassette domain-containing protein [Candidatus Lokiarchaeota archaeon]
MSNKNDFIDNKSTIDEGNNHILKIKDLNFTYPNSGIQAINNLSLTIESGDFIGLVGPNGSGKTTLLYLLAGLYKPTSGKILYKEQNIDTLNQYD